MIYLEKIFSSEGKHSQAIEPLLGGKMTKVSPLEHVDLADNDYRLNF